MSGKPLRVPGTAVADLEGSLDLLFPCPDSRSDCKRRSRRLLIDVKGSLGRDCIASIYFGEAHSYR
jgi:hypothetical protein